MAEVFTSSESNFLRSSGEDENERSPLMAFCENFPDAVEAEEYSLKDDGSESRVVGPALSTDWTRSQMSAQSWKDKLRKVKNNQCVRSDSSVSEIALGKVTDPLGFYDWMKKHPSGLEANRPMYALLQCHLQKRHWAGLEIIIMYKMGSKKNCLADAALYKKMIKIATDYGNTKLANKWLQKMLWSGFVPSLLTWNLVLVAFARDGRFAEVFSVYEQLKDHNRPPERIIYCALLSACQNADRVQEAQDIVAHMKCRGMLDSATATFREMEKAGYEPDQVAYNALIHAYARAG
ncbi:hypothetical protein AXG93_1217s1640 [Marchantia polymorpha subsp. ruderalis]|uniref:Pentatricopeptide repeat-containing protein-mitochondrial domain-containing protein n=1 Tax=Marchantia polymorpha subsp. ruderalis TaxID=1480154 RepID=A0A176VUA3_MARPO|nr:hypothetical protein AXG93_1217s1640 [Marchantia polymorpha subsp. ruderalis]